MVTQTSQKVKHLSDADPQLIRALVVEKGVDSLSPTQRTALYSKLCSLLGIPEEYKPIEFLKMNGKTITYVTAKGSNILAQLHSISLSILDRCMIEGCYTVCVRAEKNNRHFDDIGSCSLENLHGKEKENAIRKASTIAHRRALLGFLGAPFLAQEEIIETNTATQNEPTQDELNEEARSTYYSQQSSDHFSTRRLPL